MLTGLEQKVADFVVTERLFSSGQKVLLAISGGADSTAMLYVMAALVAESMLPVEICCAHVNHQLRGDDAERDQDFVISCCQKLNLPVITKRINVREYAKAEKLSIETAARKLRIDALLDIATTKKCSCVATAHQKNDNVETVLLRMVRGTGLRGLCGIWPTKEFSTGIKFVRPLLCVSRDEVIQYLNSLDLKWCTDRTNVNCEYRRNFIRHRLLPALQKDCKGNLIEQISELAKTSRGIHRLILGTADAVWPDVAIMVEQSIKLDSVKLSAQHPEVKIEIIRRTLSCLDAGEGSFSEEHYLKLMNLPISAKLQLPDSIDVLRQGGAIVFGYRQVRPKIPGVMFGINLKIPGETDFAGFHIKAGTFNYDETKFKMFVANKNNTVEWFDFDKLKLPVEVRFRKKGDRFRPLGIQAEKKIGKFLTDAKASQQLRSKVVVITDSEKIIWLCPVRINEQAKITSRTKKILQLRIC